MLVVNLFGGPGTGKSTTAAGVFTFLKHSQTVKAELVTEVAKDLTYEDTPLIRNSLHVLSEQFRRIDRLRGHVDVVVTDSPLLLPLFYRNGIFAQSWFKDTCYALHNADPSLNVMLERVKPYQRYGRTQTEDKARTIDQRIRQELLVQFDLDIPADANAPATIGEAVLERLTESNQ